MDRQMNIAFSSPPRGSYISIEKYFIFTTDITGFSSPPRGSYISIIDDELFIEYLGVLVPSTGFLYFNSDKKFIEMKPDMGSRPLHGVLIFQSFQK